MPFRYTGCVCAAAFLLVTLAALPASAQDVDFKPHLAACRNKDGVVLLKLGQPGTVWRAFCTEELEKLSCDPLDFIKQYILYSYGACYNNVEGRITGNTRVYGHIYSRDTCTSKEAKAANNKAVYGKIPNSVWPMIVIIENVAYKKNCRDYMESFD